MNKLDQSVLSELMANVSWPAVTIYVPMVVGASPPHISENQIRLKNLLRRAADELKAVDKHSPLVAKLEQVVEEHDGDMAFWEAQTLGLLICAAGADIQFFRLPIATEEYVAIDDRFHLAPLLGLWHDERQFYLLELAQHDPKLYRGSLLYGISPVKVRLPPNAEAALNLDETNQKTERQGSVGGPSSRPSGFNGHGGARDPQEEDRLRYFRLLDKIIGDTADRSLPLILAGIESEIAEYRGLSRYPHLMASRLLGNRTSDDPARLFEAVRPLIWQELVAPDHQSAVEEYQRLSGANPERIAEDTGRISEAAGQGRIDKLLARLSRQTSDTVGDSFEEVPLITFPDTKSSQRLNQVAWDVWQTRGTIYNLLPEEMPNGALMAARLRY